jgi:hypothetical protein
MAMHPEGVAFVELADGQSPPVELAAAWREGSDNPALGRALGRALSLLGLAA